MGLIITILAGALIGWLASIVMKTNAQQGALANIIIGIVGSSLGSWLFGTVLKLGGAANAGQLNFSGVLFGVLGAVVLIALLKALKILR